MVYGEPLEEEPMTTASHLTEMDVMEHLIGRDDLTIDDLADLPEDLRYELIDGRLVLTPNAIPFHQLLSIKTAAAIEECSPDEFILNVEQSLLISRRNELRPDVAVIRVEAALSSPVLPSDVPLVVEILSKSSRKFDRDGKLKKYAYVGIPAYWIIDPLADRVTFTQYSLDAGGVYQCLLQTDELVTVHQPWEITLDLPAWTRKRDHLRRVARRSG